MLTVRFIGEQHQPVRCVEVDVGVVDDSLCDPETQPLDRYRKCKNMDCPARFKTVLNVYLEFNQYLQFNFSFSGGGLGAGSTALLPVGQKEYAQEQCYVSAQSLGRKQCCTP